MRNYSMLSAWHIAEMSVLQRSDKETWEELKSGKWAPNKSTVPFCSLGADEALEQENRRMKVTGGIVGITQNAQTLTKFFLISPKLAKICSEVKGLVPNVKREGKIHHEVSKSKSSHYRKNLTAMVDCLQNFINPFTYDGNDLVNLVTMTVVPPEVANDVASMPLHGLQQYQKFVDERIIHKTINFWDTLPQCKLKLCSSTAKKIKVKTKHGLVELKEDRKLFSRLVVLCHSWPEMNLKECVGTYELSVVPRSMFSSDGSIHHIHVKSKLLHHLEELPLNKSNSHHVEAKQTDEMTVNQLVMSVAVVDGMVELNSLKLNKETKYILDLGEQFCGKIFSKYGQFSEVHVVFDSYIDNSLKCTCRDKHQHGQPIIQYRIEANTNIKSISLKKLLSHSKTKDALTEFLSKMLINKASDINPNIVVSYRNTAKGTRICADDLKSTQEEADTKMILHALHATKRGANILKIFSSDTDVLVLTIHRYPQFPKDTYFILMGAKQREIEVKKVYAALGTEHAAALPGMHAVSGADVTGSFSGKTKTSFWNRFMDASGKVLQALASLGKTQLSDQTYEGIEEYICSVYLQEPKISTLSELRWWLFSKKQVEGASMPPTQASLHPGIRRAHFQAMIWQKADVATPSLPSPTEYGWNISDGKFVPKMCELPCGPPSLLSSVQCSCGPSICASSCKCLKQGLACTEMCTCSGDESKCDNMNNGDESDELQFNDLEGDYDDDELCDEEGDNDDQNQS